MSSFLWDWMCDAEVFLKQPSSDSLTLTDQGVAVSCSSTKRNAKLNWVTCCVQNSLYIQKLLQLSTWFVAEELASFSRRNQWRSNRHGNRMSNSPRREKVIWCNKKKKNITGEVPQNAQSTIQNHRVTTQIIDLPRSRAVKAELGAKINSPRRSKNRVKRTRGKGTPGMKC